MKTYLDQQPRGSLLSVEQVAERLHLAPKTVRKLCKSGSMTAVRLTRTRRIPVTVLDDYIREHLIPHV